MLRIRQPVTGKGGHTAGVIKADESARLGWHNLRHSPATYFGSQEVPVQVI